MIRAARVALVAALSALAGCGHGATVGWPMYNDDFAGNRFVSAGAIARANVGDLTRVCSAKMPESGTFETGPIVIGSTMYVTTMHATVALDATTCAVRWAHLHHPQAAEPLNTNRGVAYDVGLVFRGYQDGRMEALDARNGRVVWNVVAADPARGEFFSSAPIAWHGLVFMGIAGADLGVRGHMMAFREADGRRVWTFDLVPQSNGGGSTWSSYTLDPASGLIYVPVGNPAPDFAPDYRPGANLFTDSVVALDAATGRLSWYHQFVANDSHDYDMAAAAVLITTRSGKSLVIAASKNGMLYAVESRSHAVAYQVAVTEIENSQTPPTSAGVHVCPGWLGGVQWNGPAYDRQTNDIYVNAVHLCGTYLRGSTRYIPGEDFLGGSFIPDPVSTWYGWLTAVDAESGQIRWRYRSPTPMIAGVTATSGGLVFTGDLNGNLLAFDAITGKLLFRAPTGGAIAGGVISYVVNGKQYVACASGNASRMTWGVLGYPTINVFAPRT